MVLEYAIGGNIDSYWIKTNYQTFNWHNKIKILSNIINGLKEIHQKGMVLTAMSHFSLKLIEEHGIKTHLVAAGAEIEIGELVVEDKPAHYDAAAKLGLDRRRHGHRHSCRLRHVLRPRR